MILIYMNFFHQIMSRLTAIKIHLSIKISLYNIVKHSVTIVS